MKYDNKYWKQKSFRDPLYGFIHLSKRETRLVNTKFMHRLTRIKQLAHSYLVYPSAVHTRFEHSLGALHMADRLCDCFEIEDKRKEIIRCAVLLHDIGHGPFSHVFENIMVKINDSDFTHEAVTRSIIENDDSIRSILQQNGNYNNEKLEDIYEDVLLFFPNPKENIKKISLDPLDKSILSGTIDADKLDYLRRDSFHIGAPYGIFDIERLLSTYTYTRDNNQNYPAILEKGTPVLESFRLARYLMYAQVYQHHTRLIADRMFLRSLELAFKDNYIDKKLFCFFNNEKNFLKKYYDMNDSSIYELVLQKSPKSSDSYKIMNDLQNRRLFKRAYVVPLKNISATKRHYIKEKTMDLLEEEISSSSGCPKNYILVHKADDEGGKKGYRDFGRLIDSKEFPMIYIDKNGKNHSYDDISPIRVTTEPYETLYVFTLDKYKNKVAKICNKIFS